MATKPKYADTAAADPSLRHEALRDWIEEETGYEADLKTVQLVSSLSNEFRGSAADDAWKAAAEEAKAQAVIEKRQNAADALFAKRLAAVNEKLEAAQGVVEAADTKRERIMAEAKVAILEAKIEDIETERTAKLAEIAEGAPVRRRRSEPEQVIEPDPPKPAANKAARKAAPAKKAATVTDIGEGRTKRAPAKKAARKRAASPVVPSDDDF